MVSHLTMKWCTWPTAPLLLFDILLPYYPIITWPLGPDAVNNLKKLAEQLQAANLTGDESIPELVESFEQAQ